MADELGDLLVKSDDWRGVKDPKKRKQIQDRLAQRARRKRLAQQKARSQACPEETGVYADPVSESSAVAVCKVQCYARTAISYGAFTSTPFAIHRPQVLEVVVPKVMREPRLPSVSKSVYAALYDNGQLLGLSCSVTKRTRSQYDCTDLPHYLVPTKLQTEAYHAQWIDSFPFPYMRDSCISYLDHAKEEHFVFDFVKMPSFVIMQGYASWDPAGWVITMEFKAKWGYLFFPDQSKSIEYK